MNAKQAIKLIKESLKVDITDTMIYVEKLQEQAILEVCVLGWCEEQINELIHYRRASEIRVKYGLSNIIFNEFLLENNILGASHFLKNSQKYNEELLDYIMENKIREGPLLKISKMIKDEYNVNRDIFKNFMILNHNLNKK